MQDAPHSASHNQPLASISSTKKASKPKRFDELDPERKAKAEQIIQESSTGGLAELREGLQAQKLALRKIFGEPAVPEITSITKPG